MSERRKWYDLQEWEMKYNAVVVSSLEATDISNHDPDDVIAALEVSLQDEDICRALDQIEELIIRRTREYLQKNASEVGFHGHIPSVKIG